MDCREFDEQVVRLEGIGELADEFVRVRLTRIEDLDLAVFDFDYDLTFAVFFLRDDQTIYGRYGGRDASGPDARQSLAGLKYAMRAALQAHRANEINPALQLRGKQPKSLADLDTTGTVLGGCVHCHQAKEIFRQAAQDAGTWTRQQLYRFPPPENVGLVLDVDEGDRVKQVLPGSPAVAIGLQPEDRIDTLGGYRVRSYADAQYALDRAKWEGTLVVRWKRGEQTLSKPLELLAGWKKGDISWRPSTRPLFANPRLYGEDLTAAERRQRGLSAKQLAFWQKTPIAPQAEAAGVKAGDIILGFNGEAPNQTAYEFQQTVARKYILGDTVRVDVLRGDMRLQLPMTFQ